MNTNKIMVLGLLFSSLALAAPVELPRTGQTACNAEDGTVIDCAGTGQDGDIQAGVEWPSPRFVDHGDGTITDNLTGLMWLQDGKYVGGINSPEWQVAFGLIESLNLNDTDSIPYADWRMPNAIEMQSLTNAGQVDVQTWLEGLGFLNMYGSWTSTTFGR